MFKSLRRTTRKWDHPLPQVRRVPTSRPSRGVRYFCGTKSWGTKRTTASSRAAHHATSFSSALSPTKRPPKTWNGVGLPTLIARPACRRFGTRCSSTRKRTSNRAPGPRNGMTTTKCRRIPSIATTMKSSRAAASSPVAGVFRSTANWWNCGAETSSHHELMELSRRNNFAHRKSVPKWSLFWTCERRSATAAVSTTAHLWLPPLPLAQTRSFCRMTIPGSGTRIAGVVISSSLTCSTRKWVTCRPRSTLFAASGAARPTTGPSSSRP
mmetsp:Transcript_3554/g.8435  ORF Transcript_3554/g.8435 Transcript_3554/m.8435 type:complete len:268 (+) Transcript_3554:2582-3385(+)